MSTARKWLPAPVLLALLVSCAGGAGVRTQYDPGSNVTTYLSSRVLIGYRDMSAGLVSGQRIMLQAEAACAGLDCAPDIVELVFYNASDSDLNIDDRRVEIVWDGERREWEAAEDLDEPAYYSVSRGEFVRVTISQADFDSMIRAENIVIAFGLTSTSQFTFGAAKRRPLVEFADELRPGG